MKPFRTFSLAVAILFSFMALPCWGQTQKAGKPFSEVNSDSLEDLSRAYLKEITYEADSVPDGLYVIFFMEGQADALAFYTHLFKQDIKPHTMLHPIIAGQSTFNGIGAISFEGLRPHAEHALFDPNAVYKKCAFPETRYPLLLHFDRGTLVQQLSLPVESVAAFLDYVRGTLNN